MPPGAFTARHANAEMVDGPPIEDVVTPFDEALTCLRGRIQPGITFAVGTVVDATGKETYADGGTGTFVTQGAGEMVQSALFRAGVTVVNRRDPNIAVVETQWGIRDIQQQIPVNFYISGSINSLDFIPGGGISATVAGVGPRYRQNRILIGLDLTMTDAFTGRIVASVPIQKQIFSREVGASIGRYFGDTLVSLDAGGQEREAVHFAMRQMLSLATFELLGQLMARDVYAPCRALVSPFFGGVEHTGTGDPDALAHAVRTAQELAEARALAIQPAGQAGPPQPQPQPTPQAAPAQPAPPPQAQPAAAQVTIEDQIREIANQAAIFAARSIAAAEESIAARSNDIAAAKAAQAIELMAAAVQLLQRGVELGLSGPEGDAAAVVVERAVQMSQRANDAVLQRQQAAATPAPAATPPVAVTPLAPTAPDAPPPPGSVPDPTNGAGGAPVRPRAAPAPMPPAPAAAPLAPAPVAPPPAPAPTAAPAPAAEERPRAVLPIIAPAPASVGPRVGSGTSTTTPAPAGPRLPTAQ